MQKKAELPMDKVIQQYNNGMSINTLAIMYGCSSITIFNRLRKEGVDTRRVKITDDYIVSKYKDVGDMTKLSKLLGVSRPYISNVLTKHNVIIIRTPVRLRFVAEDISAMLDSYVNGKSIQEVSRDFNCSYSTVYRLLTLTYGKFKNRRPHDAAICTNCGDRKSLSEFHKDKSHQNGRRSVCKICIYSNDKANRKTLSAKEKARLDADPSFRILKRLRTRIKTALKRNSKSASTMELTGCTVDELKDHLQESAINNGYTHFDINNYSGDDYHVDHIRPCNLYDLSKPEEQRKCFHYSNLQILSAKENLIKGGL